MAKLTETVWLLGADRLTAKTALDVPLLPSTSETPAIDSRASSLRIERGYWMFCSDAGFQGTCRTFGPGDHPSLPGGLNNRISSGRRISEDYPYQGSPIWNGQQLPGYTQQ